MKDKMPDEVEKGRIVDGKFASTATDGFNGAFKIRTPWGSLFIIVSDGMGWEHVSVTRFDKPNKTPSWDMMNYVKDLIWRDDETVVQYHPAKSEYVNIHPGCLHLWKLAAGKYVTPPLYCV